MRSRGSVRNPRICFDADAGAALLEDLRAALSRPTVATVVLDLGSVAYGDPAALALLQRAGEEGRRYGKPIALDAIRPDLYKALHIARIADLFTRVTATPGTTAEG